MNTWRDFCLVRALDAHVLSRLRTKEERMRKRNVTNLLTLGIVAIFLLGISPAAEAELVKVCKKVTRDGPRVCVWVDTGSVDASVLAKGIPADLAKYCEGLPGDESCYIVIEYTVFGDINPTGEPGYCTKFTDAGTLPGGTLLFPDVSEACLLYGQSVCYNPVGHYNNEGTAFNLPGPLSKTSEIITCTKGGSCLTEATLGKFEDNGGICNNNWTLDFTPFQFFGQVTICPGGFENLVEPISVGGIPEDLGDCCASDARNENGTCGTPYQEGEPTAGQPGYLWTYCDLPANCYNADRTIADACLDEDGLIKADIEFDCELCELDLPNRCVDKKDPLYDPAYCFPDGAIREGISLTGCGPV
jgi:hypothetical protein